MQPAQPQGQPRQQQSPRRALPALWPRLWDRAATALLHPSPQPPGLWRLLQQTAHSTCSAWMMCVTPGLMPESHSSSPDIPCHTAPHCSALSDEACREPSLLPCDRLRMLRFGVCNANVQLSKGCNKQTPPACQLLASANACSSTGTFLSAGSSLDRPGRRGRGLGCLRERGILSASSSGTCGSSCITGVFRVERLPSSCSSSAGPSTPTSRVKYATCWVRPVPELCGFYGWPAGTLRHCFSAFLVGS